MEPFLIFVNLRASLKLIYHCDQLVWNQLENELSKHLILLEGEVIFADSFIEGINLFHE